MKIAFLNKYQGKVNRGAETFVFELSSRLAKNHNVDVISHIDYFKLFREKYDIIIPTNGRLQSIVARKIAWLTGAKIIISGQSGAGLDDRINLYSFPDVFVALSEYQRNWAKKINPFVRVIKIPNGVDLNKFYEGRLERSGRNINKIILSVGAFTKEKRHNLTIDAVSTLDNVKLIIVGGGGSEQQNIIDYGLSKLGKERFEVISISHDQMPGIYKRADVLAFPTVPWESFGIVTLEAMASGLPVVATNDPIRREIVGNAGILVDPINTKEYSQALSEALKIDWGDRPRKQAEKFSWDDIAQKYENLLQRFADKS